jgi:hypothetical protein
MGVMAGEADPVLPGIFDGLAGMGSIIQALNYVLMTTGTLIRIEKMFQRLVDLRGIRMEPFSSDISVAFQA